MSAPILAAKHKGMRVSAAGLLGECAAAMRARAGDPGRARAGDPGRAFMLDEMLNHLRALGARYYAGDAEAVDEFLQLYCLDDKRP